MQVAEIRTLKFGVMSLYLLRYFEHSAWLGARRLPYRTADASGDGGREEAAGPVVESHSGWGRASLWLAPHAARPCRRAHRPAGRPLSGSPWPMSYVLCRFESVCPGDAGLRPPLSGLY